MGPHILVVGGTGMLTELCEALARDGGRLSHISRHASRLAGEAGFDADYHDAEAFSEALDKAIDLSGPIDLAVAWFHTLRIEAPRRLAERVRGRLFQVLGSAMVDPAHPARLDAALKVGEGLLGCAIRQVVLGFEVEGGVSRWLTNSEISQGVLRAIRTDQVRTVVGRTEPWSARP